MNNTPGPQFEIPAVPKITASQRVNFCFCFILSILNAASISAIAYLPIPHNLLVLVATIFPFSHLLQLLVLAHFGNCYWDHILLSMQFGPHWKRVLVINIISAAISWSYFGLQILLSIGS